MHISLVFTMLLLVLTTTIQKTNGYTYKCYNKPANGKPAEATCIGKVCFSQRSVVTHPNKTTESPVIIHGCMTKCPTDAKDMWGEYSMADMQSTGSGAYGTIDLDALIERLVSNRGQNITKMVAMTEAEINTVIMRSRDLFFNQPMLLELEAPLKVCGDVHGQFNDLLRLFSYGGFPPAANYLFLGDYIDRGKQSIETVILLFCYKLKYPENFFLLRGNHECAAINRVYGFYDECKRRYSIKLWKVFQDCFNCMPCAALIDEKILCMHGGLSPHLTDWDSIRRAHRPTDIPDNGILCDLLWADPDKDVKGFQPSSRGVSFLFGPDALAKFCEKHDLDLICRAHQVVEDGYEFFGNRKLVTLFSAPNYCGEFDNAGGLMSIDETLMCSFQILKPSDRKRKR